MGDDTENGTETDDDSGADVGHDVEAERTTAPMSDFTARDVAVGLVVLVVGVAIAFGVPLLAVGF